MEGEIITVSLELDQAGLIWNPEIGDEVSQRSSLSRVSIFVDPQGLSPRELRASFVWLPTVEQLVEQFEARQALIYHAGITSSMIYEAVIRSSAGMIQTCAASLRIAFGKALKELLANHTSGELH